MASSSLASGGAASSPPSWQRELAEAIRDPHELCRLLEIPADALSLASAASTGFPMLVPRSFASRMRKGDPRDPLLRQVLSIGDELLDHPGFGDDPVGETACAPLPGVLHKYRGRALLVTTGACAVHCRYCFRRHFDYEHLPRGRAWWSQAIEYLRADPSIHEVLLSGGDPLTLPDGQLADLIAACAEIPHLARVRVHTRLPVVLPSRITPELVSALTATRLRTVLVIHANHPAELSAEVVEVCQRLRQAGIHLLNQAVLLAGVNDDARVLIGLSEALILAGVQPYYLHLLDPVRGAGHFQVPDATALALHRTMAQHLPGYLVPKLVREEAGKPGKTVISA